MAHQLSLDLAVPAETRNSTTFVDNMKLPVHRWFRYSAGFNAEWAEQVIRDRGATHVLDPFGGSGTTTLAAEAAGVNGVSTDAHPFVVRIAQAKLHWRESPEELKDSARDVARLADSLPPVQRPDSGLMATCFPDAGVYDELARLRDAVASHPPGPISELLWLAVVSIVRVCSPAGTAQWQYVLPGKTKSRVAEPKHAFQTAVHNMANDMYAMQAAAKHSPAGTVFRSDARSLDVIPDGWADLVVTSPPYANNYDYADATRMEQTFLGEVDGWGDLKRTRDLLVRSSSQSVGRWVEHEALESELLEPIIDELRPVYEELNSIKKTKGGAKAYDRMLVAYFHDNARVMRALRRSTASGVEMCWVVGDSAPYGVHAPVEKWLGDLAVAAGFESWHFEKVRDRNTKWKNRKHRHPLHEGRLWIKG